MPEAASPPHPVVVGVVLGQPVEVLRVAADFARRLGAALVCAFVDEAGYAVDERPDGSAIALPINSDVGYQRVEVVDPALRARLAAALDDGGVAWEARVLVGDPTQQLSRLADRLDAAMIVVGTRRAGLGGTLHELFSGSVAAQLAHRQHRPVVVVPAASHGADSWPSAA